MFAIILSCHGHTNAKRYVQDHSNKLAPFCLNLPTQDGTQPKKAWTLKMSIKVIHGTKPSKVIVCALKVSVETLLYQ